MSLRREHAARSFKISIDRFEIISDHVLDFEMNYSIESVIPFGYIEIADAINMEAQDFQTGNKILKIEIESSNKKKYKAEFKIINGYQIREGRANAGLHLELMEETALKLSNLFWGKGWKYSTIKNVLTEVLNKVKVDKSLDIIAPTYLTNFAIPVNKPFTQVIEYFRQKHKYYIFRTKKKYICRDMNTILGEGIGKYPHDNPMGYGIRPGNFYYYDSIKDIEIQNTNRRKVNSNLPESKTHVYDLLEKEIKFFEYGFEQAKSEIATPGGGHGDSNIPKGDFTKSLVRDSYTEDTTKGYHFSTMQDLNSVTIVVASNVDLEPGQIVSMEIDPANGYFDRKIPEKFYKGEWLVYSVTEKLMKKHPIQKLKLIKPKM